MNYWKNGGEVDFVIKERDNIAELIQVCYSVQDSKTKGREIRALLKAGEELKCQSLTMITYDYEAEEDAEWFGAKGRIKFIPLWKWILS